MQDSLSISEPIYIFKDSTISQDADMDYGFIEYTSQTLNQCLPQPVLEPSLLKQKTYYIEKTMQLHPREANTNTFDWVFFIVVIFFAILAIGFKYFRIRCIDIIHSMLSIKSFETLSKSSNPLVIPSSLLLPPILSLLIFSAITYFFPNELNQFGYTKIYLIILVVTFIYFLIKILLVKFFGLLFRCTQQVNTYITNQLIYMTLNSLLIILPTFASIFAIGQTRLTLLIITLSIFALITLIRFLRGIYIIIKFPKFFNIYLFSYLCTLEILPLLLILRWIF